jgi:hypothetical protein
MITEHISEATNMGYPGGAQAALRPNAVKTPAEIFLSLDQLRGSFIVPGSSSNYLRSIAVFIVHATVSGVHPWDM